MHNKSTVMKQHVSVKFRCRDNVGINNMDCFIRIFFNNILEQIEHLNKIISIFKLTIF